MVDRHHFFTKCSLPLNCQFVNSFHIIQTPQLNTASISASCFIVGTPGINYHHRSCR